MFAVQLIETVRRKRARRNRFRERQLYVVAINRSGACTNNALDTRLTGGLQDIERSLRIDVKAVPRMFNGLGNGNQCSFMKHSVNARNGASDDVGVTNIAFQGFEIGIGRKILGFASTEIVEDANLIFSSEQGFNDMRTDEACPAGYEKPQMIYGVMRLDRSIDSLLPTISSLPKLLSWQMYSKSSSFCCNVML